MGLTEQIQEGIAIEKIRLIGESSYLIALVLEDLGDSLILLSPLMTTKAPWELSDYSSTGTSTLNKTAILGRELPSKVEERWYLSRALGSHLSVFKTFLPPSSVQELMDRRIKLGA